jgi:hypothetical protein
LRLCGEIRGEITTETPEDTEEEFLTDNEILTLGTLRLCGKVF